MDKRLEKQDWSWLPAHMPGVAKLVAEHKLSDGAAHVNRCWQRGVVERKPGWFFAREGALAVGVPWPEVADIAGWEITPTQALLCLRPAEVTHGA